METSTHVHVPQHLRAAGHRPLARILVAGLVCAGCASAAGPSAANPDGDAGPAPADTVPATGAADRPDGPPPGSGSDGTGRTPDAPDPSADRGIPGPTPSGEYALGRLLADALRAAAGTDIALIGNGAIRAGPDTGAVTRGALDRILTSPRRLIRLHVTGGQLRTALEGAVRGDAPAAQVSGVTVWYDPDRPTGSRVLTIERENGEPLRDDRIYTLVVGDSLAAGGTGFEVLRHALLREDTGITAADALATYLQAWPEPIHAPGTARLRAVASPRDRR